MKNKTLAPLFFTIVVALFATACGKVFEPASISDSSVLRYVYISSIDDENLESIDDEFMGEIYLGNIPNLAINTSISGMDRPEDEPPTFEEGCIEVFKANLDDIHRILDKAAYSEKVSEIIDKELNGITENKSLLEYTDKDVENLISDLFKKAFADQDKTLFYYQCLEVIKANPTLAADAIKSMAEAYYDFTCDIAKEEVALINWESSKDSGNTYKGYFVEYEIGTGYYVLLSLVEFDNGLPHYEILYQGGSLVDLKSCYDTKM